MKVLTSILSIAFLGLCFTISGCQQSNNEKKIGVIVPLENKALDEIVAGFSDTLKGNTNVPLKIKVANAQGDLNLQRSIIAQMKSENYAIIAPIGTTATQMTLSANPEAPIVSLAAMYTQKDREQHKPCNIAVVHDEISVTQSLNFIHEVYPQLKYLTLVHSASDKVFPDVKEAITVGKRMGIEVKPLMVPTLNDLYSIANNLPQNTQGIFILKDIMIASGISTLETVAQKNHIPLITSDQGSIQDGAGFAVGVHEREIGVEGGKLAVAILQGKSACALPITEMTKLTVFINRSTLTKENQALEPIEAAAKKNHYAVEFVNENKKS